MEKEIGSVELHEVDFVGHRHFVEVLVRFLWHFPPFLLKHKNETTDEVQGVFSPLSISQRDSFYDAMKRKIVGDLRDYRHFLASLEFDLRALNSQSNISHARRNIKSHLLLPCLRSSHLKCNR